MSEQTPDVEALAEQICVCTGNHDPGLRIECHYALTAARKVITSDWLAAREQAAERRGAVKELRQATKAVEEAPRPNVRLYGEHAEVWQHATVHATRILRARADRIEAES